MNLKKNLQKSCALMGIFFGVFYGAWMTIYLPDGINPLLYFAIIAVFSGLLFGLLMYPVLRRQQKAKLIRFPALNEKPILAMQSSMRLFVEKPKAVSGAAYLTAEALYFYVPAKMYTELSLEIPLTQITSLQLDTFNKNECLKITLSDGNEIRLRFGNASANWALKLSEAVQAYKAKQTI